MAKHLKRSADGHLLRNSAGHLVNQCAPPFLGVINAMTIWDGKLVIGGELGIVKGVGNGVNSIFMFDGTNWSYANVWISGYEDNSVVWSLAVHDGDLIVGGENFSDGGGGSSGTTTNLRRWDGSSWHNVGDRLWSDDGMSGEYGTNVKCLASLGGKLYVGGLFGKAGTADVNNLVSWDGSSWDDMKGGIGLGGGAAPSIISLYASGGKLYIVMDDDDARLVDVPLGTETYANWIVWWDGSQYGSVVKYEDMPDFNGVIRAIIDYGGDKIVAGPFIYDPPTPLGHPLAKINAGNTLDYLGEEDGGSEITKFATYGGNLIGLGYITTAQGLPNDANIAQWDGTDWLAMGDGLPSYDLRAMASYGGKLYVGGNKTLQTWDGTNWAKVL